MEKTTIYLLETFGPLAMGWVVAISLGGVFWLFFRWTLHEQREWRRITEERAQAYHDVVRQNTETAASQYVMFEERTKRIIEALERRR